MIEPGDLGAEASDCIKIMRNHDDGHAGALHFADVIHAFALESAVAHRQNFVDDEDFGIDVNGHGKGQACVHARRIVLHGHVDELFEFGEGHDVVEIAHHVFAADAHQRAVEEDVFASCEVGVKAGTQFKQC